MWDSRYDLNIYDIFIFIYSIFLENLITCISQNKCLIPYLMSDTLSMADDGLWRPALNLNAPY
jgi:hypothetical protein